MAKLRNSRKLFVGNLSSKVKEKHVRSFFERFGTIESIIFPTNRLGYCHVYFDSKKATREAFREADNTKLKGHRMWCNIQRQKHKNEEVKTHTVLVENIRVDNINDINAIKVDLQQKIQSCGHIKEVFMEKHLVDEQSGLGVAFINFDTEQAVQNALLKESFGSIHVPTYMDRSSKTILGGGYGGMYGFETEKRKYIFEDDKHRSGYDGR